MDANRTMTAAAEKLQGAALRVYLVLFAGRDRAGLVCRTYGDVAKQLGMSWSTVARAHAELQEIGLIARHAETARATQYRVSDAALLGSEDPDRTENLQDQAAVLHNLSYGVPAISSTGDTPPNNAIGAVQVRNAGAGAGAPARAPTRPTRSTTPSSVSRVPRSIPPAFSSGARSDNGGGYVAGDTSPGGREGGLSPGELEAREAELSWVSLPAVRRELAQTFDVATIKATKQAVLKLQRVSDRGATLVRLLRRGGVQPATTRAAAPQPKPAPAVQTDDGGSLAYLRQALDLAISKLADSERHELTRDAAWKNATDAERSQHPKVRAAFSRALREVVR